MSIVIVQSHSPLAQNYLTDKHCCDDIVQGETRLKTGKLSIHSIKLHCYTASKKWYIKNFNRERSISRMNQKHSEMVKQGGKEREIDVYNVL
jgi:hypothetical protein